MPVVQGGLDITIDNFTFSYWSNLQLASDKGEGFDSGEMTETDIIVDYSFDINDLLSVSLGNAFYAFDGFEDTSELYLILGLNTLLNPSFSVYYDWDVAEDDGLYYSLAISHDIALAESLNLNLGALVSYNQSSDYLIGDYNDFHNYELSCAVDYAITDQINVGVSFLYSEGISSAARDNIDSEILAGATVSLAF